MVASQSLTHMIMNTRFFWSAVSRYVMKIFMKDSGTISRDYLTVGETVSGSNGMFLEISCSFPFNNVLHVRHVNSSTA